VSASWKVLTLSTSPLNHGEQVSTRKKKTERLTPAICGPIDVKDSACLPGTFYARINTAEPQSWSGHSQPPIDQLLFVLDAAGSSLCSAGGLGHLCEAGNSRNRVLRGQATRSPRNASTLLFFDSESQNAPVACSRGSGSRMRSRIGPHGGPADRSVPCLFYGRCSQQANRVLLLLLLLLRTGVAPTSGIEKDPDA